MPILEAMSYRLPVAVSDIPVFHEVAGDAAVYFNQDNPSAIASTLTKVLTDAVLRQRLLGKSTDQLKKFDWDRVASDVMEKFRELTA